MKIGKNKMREGGKWRENENNSGRNGRKEEGKEEEEDKRRRERERDGVTCYADNALIVMPGEGPSSVAISLSVCLSVNAYMKVIVFTRA